MCLSGQPALKARLAANSKRDSNEWGMGVGLENAPPTTAAVWDEGGMSSGSRILNQTQSQIYKQSKKKHKGQVPWTQATAKAQGHFGRSRGSTGTVLFVYIFER